MTTNFEIEDNYALVYQDQLIDLHNNYDLAGYEYQVAKRELRIKWTKSTGEWVSQDEPATLTIIHQDVFYYNIGYDNEIYEFPDDDKCLGAISFVSSEERESNDQLTSRVEPAENDDILYIFETDHCIRVGCRSIVLIPD